MGVEHPDVVVVGAGLAGLAAARRLAGSGRHVLVLEAAHGPGGRVRTDRRGGYLFDRGFQLLNPAYPQVRRVLDLPALRLRPFARGVVIGGRQAGVLADPRRHPRLLAATVRGPGTVSGMLRLGRWLAEVGYLPSSRLRARPDRALAEELAERGVGAELEALLRTFLVGVLAETALDSSARMATMLLRAFVRGTPALPDAGMCAVPDQLAADLPAGSVRLGTAVRAVTGRLVEHDGGTLRAGAVIVATDPLAAQSLTGCRAPAMRSLTTYYHLAPHRPRHARFLHLDPDRAGPVINTAVVSAVAPGYAPTSATLVASTVLGADAQIERAVREHTARILGLPEAGWESVAVYPIERALPVHPPGQLLRRRVHLADGLFVAGDHRDTPSIQGALVSGRRAADAALAHLDGPR